MYDDAVLSGNADVIDLTKKTLDKCKASSSSSVSLCYLSLLDCSKPARSARSVFGQGRQVSELAIKTRLTFLVIF